MRTELGNNVLRWDHRAIANDVSFSFKNPGERERLILSLTDPATFQKSLSSKELQSFRRIYARHRLSVLSAHRGPETVNSLTPQGYLKGSLNLRRP